jgi:preprotein translocase subunit SecD
MSSLQSLRDYWRVVLLVVLLFGSTVVIATPMSPVADTNQAATGNESTVDDSAVNLKYGLELAGGTSVSAPLVGVSAENVEIPRENRADVVKSVSNNLGIDSYDVRVRYGASEGSNTATVEVYQDIPPKQLGDALRQTSANTSEMEVSDSVTQATYNEAEETLQARFMQTGLSGGEVTQTVSANGERYLLVKVPNQNQEEVLRLIGDRGLLRVEGVYPSGQENGSYTYSEETVVTIADIQSVGQIETERQRAGVPLTLTDDGADKYVQFLQENQYLTEQNVSSCDIQPSSTGGVQARGYCMLTFKDSEYLHGGGISPGLAEEMRSGQFEQSPTILLVAQNESEARNLQVTLRAGAMPTDVALEEGTVQYLSPSQASDFKMYSLIIGLLTVLAVAGTVAYRYRDPSVAAPMTLTAMSEVWLLVGFVSLVQLPLDLSHIAGLIAVVGTGVDDLIIIADEVIAGGDISSRRVFQSRFRKAFWVIGVAAITTIIAMSPLAVLSLGDLQGFAIVTIVGVLIGVLITRPAYGDILKWVIDRRDR